MQAFCILCTRPMRTSGIGAYSNLTLDVPVEEGPVRLSWRCVEADPPRFAN